MSSWEQARRSRPHPTMVDTRPGLANQRRTRYEDVDAAEALDPARRRRRTREEWALLWAKSVCWRLISTGTLFFIAWLVTDSWSTGGVVALIHMIITIVIYVPHDLAWERYSARRTSRRQSGAPNGTAE